MAGLPSVMVHAIITLVLKQKIAVLFLVRADGYFMFTGTDEVHSPSGCPVKDIISESSVSSKKKRHPLTQAALLHHDNIIDLPEEPGGRACHPFRILRKGVVR